MSESASTDSLMARPASPITDDDQDLFRSFFNGPEEFTLHPLGCGSSGTSLSPRARPSSVEEQDVENLPKNPVRHAPGLRNLISDWSSELFALVSSAVSLCALIILARQNGQQLSTWTLPLSLNTVVSLLNWVCFGAGITIGLLAIDPFLQGLVQYVGKMSSMVDRSASIMRSHGLDVGEWVQKASGEDMPCSPTEHLRKTTLYNIRSDYGQDMDSPALEAIERTIGTSLAGVDEEKKCLVPRSDLQLRLLDQDNWLPRDIRRTFNITQRSITTMMSSLDYEAIDFINRALSNSTNITATFNNVAHLMSYQMRDTNGSPVQGYTREWVIYIRVRWPLISGPVVLLLATVLFSGWVVMESRGIELETFKSEPLEMLLYGFDAKSRDYLRVTRKAGQNVEDKIIQLEEAAEGPELRLKDRPE
ncbi:uncharacterized protein NECHADRAFT_81555 [Fusarium vanettenii 77-13-4]|uniref:Uncharacterized protein n=1 Tax=Fusarium vanettenii (strain ATCC MYA-4622 / CBS 123669 / FGSC 9596 / NRRL 45880 / 77-13-4) TaxID=660122 RepID=C7Z8Q9_FUSV7|nr:uncharacterized protein NECHADRAFT_81555 [Fusarium vanettenii 77-13-4]EEU38994.1 hypothetical protein NECHADRAFT_81555 [Fusarium vanettenii 77-13-4]